MENILDKNTIEFLTVANEYCAFLEKSEKFTRREFVAKMQKILPLLYLKAAMLPQTDEYADGEAEIFLSEYDYEYIKNKTSQRLGSVDGYINIFPSEDNYAEYEQAEISECAADIYQDLKNFAENYRSESEEAMKAALIQCVGNFKDYWGMRLISLQAALHRAAYLNTDDDNDEDTADIGRDAINRVSTTDPQPEYNGNSLINNFFENYHKKI